MSFLDLENRLFLVAGLANRKSVAYHIARGLREEGAEVVLTVRDSQAAESAAGLMPSARTIVCDVEKKDDIRRLAVDAAGFGRKLDGFVHSLAFADYGGGMRPFHETPREHFLQAAQISMFSLVEMAGALKDSLSPDASVVTISISHVNMASENYGYMAPIKAALDSSVAFLAKSFSAFSRVRFNAVNAGLLKTSASAGIPDYIENYLFAEKATLRKKALATQEVANLAIFLLSPRSSGINAQRHVIDAGMSVNFFDRDIVKANVNF